jgi:hypothetical protein
MYPTATTPSTTTSPRSTVVDHWSSGSHRNMPTPSNTSRLNTVSKNAQNFLDARTGRGALPLRACFDAGATGFVAGLAGVLTVNVVGTICDNGDFGGVCSGIETPSG